MSSSIFESGGSGRPRRGLSAAGLALLVAIGTPSATFPHGGEIEVGGGGARGPVQLSAAQATAIGLETTTAGPHPLATILTLNGEVQLLPDRQADVSLRISGRIKELFAKLGDSVTNGQRLAVVESRVLGDPPPTVTVTAPMAGIIETRNVVLGQAVEPNTQIFRISDRSAMVVLAKVYEEDLGQVKLGQEAHVRVLSYQQKVFSGKLTLIEPNLDPSSRTVKVWVELANPDGLLKPNMFATTSLVLNRNESALTIPNNAILEANGEKFVFVRQGDAFDRVDIMVGATDDEYSEVTDGLVPGDEVVVQAKRQVYTMWLTGSSAKPAD
jgi:multidrug efflux pump subunit AcrA (membrane-fusion protein)